MPPMPDYIPRWNSLSEQKKKIYAHQMEVYAGYLAHTDYEVGRMISNLKTNGEYDNTLIFYIVGDNGASPEGNNTGSLNSLAFYNGVTEDENLVLKNIDKLGGPDSFGHYAAGWAVAGDTPFAWTKGVSSDFGGTRNGMVVSWPNGIKAQNDNTLRHQWTHITDIVPTILDAAKLPQPKTVDGIKLEKIVGTSIVPSFNNAKVKSTHTTQYFELGGSRAIYHKGWLARVIHFPLWEGTQKYQTLQQEDSKWELFDITNDFALSNNIAKANPQKLKELRALFDQEAKKYNVYPIDDRTMERMNAEIAGRPDALYGKTSITLYPGATGIPENSFLNTKNRSWEVSAIVDINAGSDANGVII